MTTRCALVAALVGMLALPGCGGTGTACGSADLAALPAGAAPAFVVLGRGTATSQIFLLDAEGVPIDVGGTPIWARSGTRVPTGALGPEVGLARGATWGGVVVLPREVAQGSIAIDVPAGTIAASLTAASDVDDATVAHVPGDTILVSIADGQVIATSETGGTDPIPLGVSGIPSALGVVEGMTEGETAVIVVLVAPEGGMGPSTLVVADPRNFAILHRETIPEALGPCRFLAVAAPGVTSLPTEAPVAIACVGSVGLTSTTGYALYAVSRTPTVPPRLVATVLGPEVGTSSIASPIVATPGGTIVHAHAESMTTLALVAIDVEAGTSRTLGTVAGAPPIPPELVGAGAYHHESGVLFWPSGTGVRLLRWTVPSGSTTIVPTAPVTPIGCGFLPAFEIVAVTGGGSAPVDAGVPVDAGTEVDAGDEPDAGEPDAGVGDDAGSEPDAPP